MKPMLTLLYTTIATQEQGENLAKLALNQKLAVCVNIIPQGISMYLWHEKQETHSEFYMIFKTLPAKAEALKTCILSHHPYDIPVLLEWNVHTTNAYFDTMQDQCNL